MIFLIEFYAMNQVFYDAFKSVGGDASLVCWWCALALSTQNVGGISWALALIAMSMISGESLFAGLAKCGFGFGVANIA